MKHITEPSLVCIFAEAIRNELSGQNTIIGTYMGRSIQLPAVGNLVLPTFAGLFFGDAAPDVLALIASATKSQNNCTATLTRCVFRRRFYRQRAPRGVLAQSPRQ